MSKKLNKIFNIPDEDANNLPIVGDDISQQSEANTNLPIEYTGNPLEQITDQMDVDDLKEIRENIKRIAKKGEEALDQLIEIADQSQEARAYEVVGQLISRIVEANKELGNQVHQHIQRKQTKITYNENHITQNNLTLTTNDLLEILNRKTQEDISPPSTMKEINPKDGKTS